MQKRRKDSSKNTSQATAEVTKTEAVQYEELALKNLREAGYRITMPRVQVIRALADTKIALSAYAIHEKIVGAMNGKIDVVSVYRILATLHEVGLIHHTETTDGYFPCRSEAGAKESSELLVDTATGVVGEFNLSPELMDAVRKEIASMNFEIAKIHLEVSGAYAA